LLGSRELLHELHFIREFTRLFLRKDQIPFHGHFENPTRRLDQFDLKIAIFLQQRRQTDGTGFVTSHRTEFNTRLHRFILNQEKWSRGIFAVRLLLPSRILPDVHQYGCLCTVCIAASLSDFSIL